MTEEFAVMAYRQLVQDKRLWLLDRVTPAASKYDSPIVGWMVDGFESEPWLKPLVMDYLRIQNERLRKENPYAY